jgi:hypothetical protein
MHPSAPSLDDNYFAPCFPLLGLAYNQIHRNQHAPPRHNVNAKGSRPVASAELPYINNDIASRFVFPPVCPICLPSLRLHHLHILSRLGSRPASPPRHPVVALHLRHFLLSVHLSISAPGFSFHRSIAPSHRIPSPSSCAPTHPHAGRACRFFPVCRPSLVPACSVSVR